MKISEVLRKARKVLVEDKCLFVCSAVEYTSAPTEDKVKTKEYIQNLIHPHATVSIWLYEEVGIEWRESWCKRKIMPYRIRWIDHMINELKKEGK